PAPTAPANAQPAPVLTHPAVAPQRRGSSSLPLSLVAVFACGLGLLVAVLVRRGRRQVHVQPPPPTTGVVRPVGASDTMPKLLEVSRRLTDVAATGNVDRAIVRNALDLVYADGAALVRRNNGDLVVAAETDDGLLVADALGDGVVAQVAATGQPLLQVSATERS